ncbi:hypothetical protein [Nisaea denitrificans]|uniref:hypothetical protein n=1 Tax=Nisaea denitrificans TaxID=390877 RepID=UPI0004914357|nr:hypothetical protein [Nisaea denitrificans]|tara:strand:+ start:938 stop:1438 length:501 start_codon:yes stop_codon:yes gene_type:complete
MIVALAFLPMKDAQAFGWSQKITKDSFYDFDRAQEWWNTIKTREEFEGRKRALRKPFGLWTPTKSMVERYKNDSSYEGRQEYFDFMQLFYLWQQIEAASVSSWANQFGAIPGSVPTPWGVNSPEECERMSNLNIFSGDCTNVPNWMDKAMQARIAKAIDTHQKKSN